MVAFGEAQGEIHGGAAPFAEHAAGLAPAMGAEHFPHADQGSNGEHGLELEHAAPGEQPPAIDKVSALGEGATEHLGEFDLELAEHAEALEHPEHGGIGAHGEHHETGEAALGEYQGDHRIEPGSGEHAEGDPEFQFAGDESGEGMEEGESEDHHSMGGIATLVQTAPPAKKRRQAPLAVKLVGILLFFGFGFLGCYLVYGAFLWMHSDQFHLKRFFPTFLQNRVATAPVPSPHKKGSEKPTLGENPVTPPTGTADTNPPTTPPVQTGSQDNSAKTPATGDNTTAVVPPKKPGQNDLAQQSPDKSNAPLETSEDPLKTPPPDLDKGDSTKPDASGIAPPKFDTTVPPLGDVKPPVAPKTTVDSTDKPTPTPDKTTVNKPVTDKSATDKPATDKPATDKPENPVPASSTDKPLDKPADNPSVPSGTKSPIAAQLDDADAAVAATVQTEDNLKSASSPGTEPSTLRRARHCSIQSDEPLGHGVGRHRSRDRRSGFQGSIRTVGQESRGARRIDGLGGRARHDRNAGGKMDRLAIAEGKQRKRRGRRRHLGESRTDRKGFRRSHQDAQRFE